MPLPSTSLPHPLPQPVEALSAFIIDLFRLNGCLLAAGDALVGDLGLTSARWQVLGAIAHASVPLPVASIARNMGLTRQAVQRVVDEMRAERLVRLAPNPHHRRAVLVLLTPTGEDALAAATRLQVEWATGLTLGLSVEEITAASGLLRELRRRLGQDETGPIAD